MLDRVRSQVLSVEPTVPIGINVSVKLRQRIRLRWAGGEGVKRYLAGVLRGRLYSFMVFLDVPLVPLTARERVIASDVRKPDIFVRTCVSQCGGPGGGTLHKIKTIYFLPVVGIVTSKT